MTTLEKHLNDLFAAIVYCYQQKLLMPCLVLLYSGIDVVASLEPSTAQTVRVRFEKWVERYVLSSGSLPCTAKELYAARCGVVHTFTPDSDISRAGNARIIAYAHGDADVKKLDEATALMGRQGIQVNVHLRDLIGAFHAGWETYLKEVTADIQRWKEVANRTSMWTTDLDSATVDQYLKARSSGQSRAR